MTRAKSVPRGSPIVVFLVLGMAVAQCGCDPTITESKQNGKLNQASSGALVQTRNERQISSAIIHRDAEHGVLVRFPFQPQITSDQAIPGDAFADGIPRSGHVICAEDPVGVFGCIFYKHRIPLEEFDADALLNAAARNIAKTENGTIQSQFPVSVSGSSGRDVVITLKYQGTEELKRVRILCNTSTVCYAMWMGGPNDEPHEVVLEFLQSLKLD